MRDSTSEWALDLALKMRLRFGQASVKGNDIAKKQREQSTSAEPTRKAVWQLQGSKTQVPTGTRQEYKGGKGSWKTIAWSQWLRTPDTRSQQRKTREVEPFPGAHSHPRSTAGFCYSAGRERCQKGIQTWCCRCPKFPREGQTSRFYEKPFFLLLWLQ